jgi:DNA repair protein RadD
MIYEKRWYQTEAVNALFNYFEHATGNPLVCLPTGSGKSIVIADFIKLVFSFFPFQRVIVGTHVKEIIKQNYSKILEVWERAPAGIYSAGLKKKDIAAPIVFAGIASLVNAIDLFGHVDLFLIDEAHLLGDKDDSMYMQVINQMKRINPKMKIIGFTATPFRTGMGLLTNGPIFTDICYNLCTIEGFKRLFDEYYLVPPRPRRVDTLIDVKGVSIVNGDYAPGQLQRAAGREDITWKLINEALEHGKDRMCRLMFCSGVEHAEMSAKMLQAFGLKAETVNSRMPEKDRDDIIKSYYNGELDTLTVFGIGTTGFDVPRIDHIIGARPTTRVGLHVQMIGRGTRPFEVNGWRKVDCLVSDHAANTRNLGPIDDPYIPKQKSKNPGDAPVKLCPACDCYNHASARVCQFCGELFDIQFKVKTVAFDDELVSSTLPNYEWFKVTNVFYTQHIKRHAGPNDKPSIKAQYQCGLRMFTEFVPIESNFPVLKRQAVDWWRQRFQIKIGEEIVIPKTALEAMQFIDRLVPPKRIKVWVNREYPQVTDCEF